MFYHGVLITVSNKHLMIVEIKTLYTNLYTQLFPSEFSGNKLKLTGFSRDTCSETFGRKQSYC